MDTFDVIIDTRSKNRIGGEIVSVLDSSSAVDKR